MNDENIDQGLAAGEPEDSGNGTPDGSGTDTVDQQGEATPSTELEQLRQQMERDGRHADHKITAQGQENSALQRELQQRDTQIQNLQQQMNQIQTQQPSDSYDGYGGEATEKTAGVDQSEWNLYKQGVGELVNEVYSLKDQLSSSSAAQQQETEVAKLQQQFGLNTEDARLALDYQAQGDFLNAHKVIDLASAQSKSRQAARERRSNYEEAVGTTADFRVDNQNEKGLAEIFGETRQPQAVAKQLADDPDLLDKLAGQFTTKA